MTHRTHLSLLGDSRASLGSQMVKNPPAMQETWLRPLGWQDPLEKGTATHSTILAWRIPWKEEPGRLQSMGSQRVEHDSVTFTFSLSGDSQMSSFPEPPPVCTLSQFTPWPPQPLPGRKRGISHTHIFSRPGSSSRWSLLCLTFFQ